MKNDIIKIAQSGLEWMNLKKREELQKFKTFSETEQKWITRNLLVLKKIAERPYDKNHDLAEFLLGMSLVYEALNKAQDSNRYKTKSKVKQLEELWREEC